MLVVLRRQIRVHPIPQPNRFEMRHRCHEKGLKVLSKDLRKASGTQHRLLLCFEGVVPALTQAITRLFLIFCPTLLQVENHSRLLRARGNHREAGQRHVDFS
jgi:hypothetical protein